MHARELIELAGLVAAHAPVLVRTPGRISDALLEQYWVASKSRQDRWGRALRRLSSRDANRRRAMSQRPACRGLLEEIVTGELLTRVWAAVASAHDRFRGTEQAGPIAESVLAGHLEARHRVLTLLVQEPGLHVEIAFKLDRLRRSIERWTDVLLGFLPPLDDLGRFAVDLDRARDFADDFRGRIAAQGTQLVCPLMLASLRATYRRVLSPSSPNGDLNARIASSLLTCLQPELCDAAGLFRSGWLLRMSNVTDDTQELIEELLAT
jgi:hypothetical protein